jgi:hypothetical protein
MLQVAQMSTVLIQKLYKLLTLEDGMQMNKPRTTAAAHLKDWKEIAHFREAQAICCQSIAYSYCHA